jgi:alanine racemase
VAFTLMVESGWRERVQHMWTMHPGIVPVVKGNGYGFGRPGLIGLATQFGADELAVGTVHELTDLPPSGPHQIVLTPAVASDLAGLKLSPNTILTVGSIADVTALAGREHRVIVKMVSSMRRYGANPEELSRVAAAAETAGFRVHGYAIHLPLPQPAGSNVMEAQSVLESIPGDATVYVSHLTAAEIVALKPAFPRLRLRPRVGTELWIGGKEHLKLVADVVEVRPVESGQSAGYRRWPVDEDGHLVMVSAGTAHGVQPLPDGRSPFHFERRRVALHEPPHMHTSMLVVPTGSPLPSVGDQVDVQQPLTRVWPDRVQFVT